MSLLLKVDIETLDYASGGQPFDSINAGASIGANGTLDYALGGQPFDVFAVVATITATSATTNANDTSAASGTIPISGSSATTNANDTSSAAGKTTIVGTSATTNHNDTSATTGTTTVTGTSATTNNNDTSQADGTVSDAISGSAACTEAPDTSDATGIVTAPDASQNSGGWPEHIPPRRVRKVVQELEQAEEEQPARRFTIDARPEVPVVLDKGAQEAVDRFLQSIQDVARQPISLEDTEEDDVAQLLQDDFQIRQMIGTSLASQLSDVLDELMGKKPLHDR